MRHSPLREKLGRLVRRDALLLGDLDGLRVVVRVALLQLVRPQLCEYQSNGVSAVSITGSAQRARNTLRWCRSQPHDEVVATTHPLSGQTQPNLHLERALTGAAEYTGQNRTCIFQELDEVEVLDNVGPQEVGRCSHQRRRAGRRLLRHRHQAVARHPARRPAQPCACVRSPNIRPNTKVDCKALRHNANVKWKAPRRDTKVDCKAPRAVQLGRQGNMEGRRGPKTGGTMADRCDIASDFCMLSSRKVPWSDSL